VTLKRNPACPCHGQVSSLWTVWVAARQDIQPGAAVPQTDRSVSAAGQRADNVDHIDLGDRRLAPCYDRAQNIFLPHRRSTCIGACGRATQRLAQSLHSNRSGKRAILGEASPPSAARQQPRIGREEKNGLFHPSGQGSPLSSTNAVNSSGNKNNHGRPCSEISRQMLDRYRAYSETSGAAPSSTNQELAAAAANVPPGGGGGNCSIGKRRKTPPMSRTRVRSGEGRELAHARAGEKVALDSG
jgi:hypothetical protein